MSSHIYFAFPTEALAWCCTVPHGQDLPFSTIAAVHTKIRGWGSGCLCCSPSCHLPFPGHDDL